MIGQAQQRLVLFTPYFNLPGPIRRALDSRIRAGCRVTIVLGDKTANDFYIPPDEPFKTIGALPYLYEANLRRYCKARQRGIDSIDVIEKAADKITHDTVALLHKTFITPFDRESIHQLITQMDDILDLIQDGRIARMLDAQSRMGAELDSLCDAIGFGVTPALVTYYTIVIHATDPRIADLGWVAAITYGACIVLRLARFNTLLTDDTLPTFHKEFFVGVPAPVAALLALVPVVALMHFGPGWWADPVLTSVWLIAVAALAFSRIPTLSLKSTRIKGNLVPLLLIAAVVVIGGILTIPLLVVLVMSVAYLVHIPFAVRTYRWLAATPEAWEVHGRDRRAIRRTARRRRIRL